MATGADEANKRDDKKDGNPDDFAEDQNREDKSWDVEHQDQTVAFHRRGKTNIEEVEKPLMAVK